MTSIRARCLNGLMKLTIRRTIRPGVTIEKMREQSRRTDRRMRGLIRNCEVQALGGTPTPISRVTAHGASADRNLLYFHGGGFCTHLPNIYRRHAARLSAAMGAVVYLVDYRLAPENPLATCYEDALAAYQWLLEQGLPASRIAISGDSAGGALTLGTAQRIRDSHLPLPVCLLMVSPGLDARFETPSMRTNDGKDPMFRREGLLYLRDTTFAHGEDPADPTLSPGLGSLAGLPPMRFDVGTTELLLDDSRLAAEKARSQGSTALVREWRSMSHVFQITSWLPETRHWLGEASDFARKYWNANSGSRN